MQRSPAVASVSLGTTRDFYAALFERLLEFADGPFHRRPVGQIIVRLDYDDRTGGGAE